MTNRFDHILQFKVTLKHIRPPVWRRIQVPCTYTFWDLHVAIQDAMGWLDCHLHLFRIQSPVDGAPTEIGTPEDDPFMDEHPPLAGWEVPIANYFTLTSRKATYDYDFGDSWQHEVVLEDVIDRAPRTRVPRCVDGAGACPPEDCGGPPGYQELLRVLADRSHPEHDSMLEWLGGHHDPAGFDPRDVRFDDPQARWKIAFAGRHR